MDKTSDSISGLRFQKYNSGEIHVHDDSKGVKFISSTTEFKKDIEKAVKDLLQDGAVIIEGTTKEQLVLIRNGKGLNAFVISDKNISTDLKSFCNSL